MSEEWNDGRRAFVRGVLTGGVAIATGGLSACVRAQARPSPCVRTEPNIEGPFYRPGAPVRAELTSPAGGERLVLVGRVLRCGRPLVGAELDVWQADARGEYDLAGFDMRGRVFTAPDGSYRIATLVPGRYRNGPRYRPAHIHVKVRGAGRELTTQLYFHGDPENRHDPWVRRTLVLRPRRGRDGLVARFDFQL